MPYTKRAYSKTRKLFIYGAGTIATLLAFLFTLTNYGINVELNDTCVTCAGNDLEPCEGYFNISLESYNLCFGSSFQLYLNDTDGVNYTVYKADQRYRSDNPARWKPFTFKGCLRNETKYEFKVKVSKPIDKTVKWSLKTGVINDLDPVFKGYNSDDFFINLIENTAHATYATSIFKIRNPTTFPIPIDKNKFNFLFDKISGELGPIEIYFYNESNAKNITGYVKNCSSYEIIEGNHTNSIVNTTDCTSIPTDWYWDNSTVWQKFNSLSLKPKTEYPIKIETNYAPMLGTRKIEWIPKMNVAGVDFVQSKWAWWINGYDYYWNITAVNTSFVPVFYPINITINSSITNAIGQKWAGIALTDKSNNTIPIACWDLNSNGLIDANEFFSFKIKGFIGSSSNETYSLYYGNNTIVPNECRGYNIVVMEMYDQFNGTTINTTLWNITTASGVIRQDGVLIIKGENARAKDTAVTVQDFSPSANLSGYEIKYKINLTTDALDTYSGIGNAPEYPSGDGMMLQLGSAPSSVKEHYTSVKDWDKITYQTWHNVSIYLNKTQGYVVWFNKTYIWTSAVYTVPTGRYPMYEAVYEPAEFAIDNVFIKKYVEPQPTIFFTGTEQTQLPPPAGTCNITISGSNTTYGQLNNVVCSGANTYNCTLWRNNTNVTDTYNNSNMIHPAAFANFTCNNSHSGQWNSLDISKGDTYVRLGSLLNVTYPNTVTPMCFENNTDRGTSCGLFRNKTNLNVANVTDTENNTAMIYGGGAWNITGNMSATQNFTGRSNISYIVVSQASTTIYLALNGTEGNRNFTSGVIINVSAWKNINYGNLYLYRNTTIFLNSTLFHNESISSVNSSSGDWADLVKIENRDWTDYAEGDGEGSWYPNYTIPNSTYNFTYVFKIHTGNACGNSMKKCMINVSLWNYTLSNYQQYYNTDTANQDINVSIFIKNNGNISDFNPQGKLVFNLTARSDNYELGFDYSAGFYETLLEWDGFYGNEIENITSYSSSKAYNFTTVLIHQNYTASNVTRILRILNTSILIEMPKQIFYSIEDGSSDSSQPTANWSSAIYQDNTTLMTGGCAAAECAYPRYGWYKFNTSNVSYADNITLNLHQDATIFPSAWGFLSGYECNSSYPCVTYLYYSSNQTWTDYTLNWNEQPSWDNYVIAKSNITSNEGWRIYDITNHFFSIFSNATYMLRIPMLSIQVKGMNFTGGNPFNNQTYWPYISAEITKYLINETSCNGTVSQYQNGTCTPRGQNPAWQWIRNITNIGDINLGTSINISARWNATLPSCMTHYLSTNSTLETLIDYNVSNTTNVKLFGKGGLNISQSQTFWGFFVLNNCTAGITTNATLIFNSTWGV